MTARMLLTVALGAMCLLAGFGCSRAEADAVHYGYAGSSPAVCAFCED